MDLQPNRILDIHHQPGLPDPDRRLSLARLWSTGRRTETPRSPSPDPIVYDQADRPDVEVSTRACGAPERFGWLSWASDGVELHQVQYRRPGELSRHIDSFTADQVRADTVERTCGRTGGYRRDMTTSPPPTEDSSPPSSLPKPTSNDHLSGPREPDVEEPTIDDDGLGQDD